MLVTIHTRVVFRARSRYGFRYKADIFIGCYDNKMPNMRQVHPGLADVPEEYKSLMRGDIHTPSRLYCYDRRGSVKAQLIAHREKMRPSESVGDT